jgi:tryptophan 2,3-dioxygenase
MLFIVLQQAQELWFKQLLHELRTIVGLLTRGELPDATRLLHRVNHILRVLSEELEVMETLSPHEFMRFRDLLKPSSGFESEQFRLLELASGLEDETFLRIVERLVDMDAFRARWPKTLRTAFLETLGAADADPVSALLAIYDAPSQHPALHALAEALAEYELRFAEWRFHHVLLVERIIGDRAPGTGGSSGTAYLDKTVKYRFFPELWEARNQFTERATAK